MAQITGTVSGIASHVYVSWAHTGGASEYFRPQIGPQPVLASGLVSCVKPKSDLATDILVFASSISLPALKFPHRRDPLILWRPANPEGV